ncbi:hypothetical protein FNW25_09310 [Flavobacterium franklandianum]|uniref:Uncharacterized protein n=1 Tax=Flavobacterium franklandianum TaxID=2594430 RepID=A0A553CU56_9FLAO|nr:hypothetical protein [Flavobacterium franklandianum]TRX24049.1 hypothetical protein FNW17_02410 [Flavobacterium franklandianum]TRX25383.1 hypothetical protein FNW25_09310 [Flavobacterium franklandianum]
MRKQIITTLLLLIASVATFAQSGKQKQADKATEEWRYEIECAGVGTDGTYLIKVWSYSKKPIIAITQAKKNAVHGIIFKGFSGDGRGCTSQKPMATNTNIEAEKADFFDLFFEDGGKYMKFVSESSDGNVDASDRMKVGKEYKIGVIVSVSKDALRRDLEAAGIIRGLSSGF